MSAELLTRMQERADSRSTRMSNMTLDAARDVRTLIEHASQLRRLVALADEMRRAQFDEEVGVRGDGSDERARAAEHAYDTLRRSMGDVL